VKLNFDAVMKHFPMAKPRDIQVEAIRKAVEAYNNGAQYVVLEAPTGAGKSGISMTFARAFGRSYILTLTAQLQHQYLRDFEHLGLAVLKGRNKFQCARMAGAGTCADAKLLRISEACGLGCVYRQARDAALAAPHCVANYHSFYWNVGRFVAGRASEWKEEGLKENDFTRELAVLDEAHATESFLLDQLGITIRLDKLSFRVAPPPDELYDAQPYFDYIERELRPALSKYIDKTPDIKAKEEMSFLLDKLGFVLDTREDQWIPERDFGKDGKLNRNWFSMKPLYVRRYGPRVWGGGKYQLLLSGTVLSAFQLVNNIGLDPEKGEHIEMDSPFPAENRPIYVGNLDMTKKARDTSWPLMAQLIDNILNSHPNEKGILLCPSNEMLKYIHTKVSRLNATRFIFAYGEDREEKYKAHVTGKRPSVLAASGYWEGADLKGDASRFQIIPAAPRPMWQGQVAVRAKQDSTWYRWLTWTKFIQGIGRSIRDEKDTAATYVLDRELRVELRRPDSMIPKWVQKAVHIVD
jgi:Rad3-related DNA helicase